MNTITTAGLMPLSATGAARSKTWIRHHHEYVSGPGADRITRASSTVRERDIESVEGVDDVGEAEPDRGLRELRALQVTAVAGPAGVQEPALGRRALPVLDLQVLAEAGRVRNR
jgi:hypothetical protein